MNWSELRALWDERDNRYRIRKSQRHPQQMSPGEAVAVREYRRTEVAMLPQEQRERALLELNRWYPPVAR